MIPPLERHCGSWFVISRATGRAILETFERSTAERVNQAAYEVLTAAQWLGRGNRQLREARAAGLPIPAHLAPEPLEA